MVTPHAERIKNACLYKTAAKPEEKRTKPNHLTALCSSTVDVDVLCGVDLSPHLDEALADVAGAEGFVAAGGQRES